MSAVVTEDAKAVAGSRPRLLFVVARSHLGLYRQLSRGFDGCDDVETILDRRSDDRAGLSAERPPTERRAAPPDDQLESQGWFIAWRARVPAEDDDAPEPDRSPSPLMADLDRRRLELAAMLVARESERAPSDALSERDRRGIAAVSAQLALEYSDPVAEPRKRWRGFDRAAALRAGAVLLTGLCASVLFYAVARTWTTRPRPAATDARPGPAPAVVAYAPDAPPPKAAPAPVAAPRPVPAERPPEPRPTSPASPAPARRVDARKELRGAFAAWIDTANRGQVASHMEWYADPVAVFYSGKNVPLSSVMTLRRKTFTDATRIEVRAGEPEIRLAPDELSAAMVFKKTYRFEGPRIDRRGVAVQELTWRKTADGWRIVGEKTLRELPSESPPRPKRS
jgi:ketosteroid isomerase-like protein